MKIKLPNFIDKYKLYWGVLLFFVVWMLFFDEYTWVKVHRDKQKLEKLENEQTFYKQKINDDRERLSTLKKDIEALEKYAREEYLLKKENEDVYLIIEE